MKTPFYILIGMTIGLLSCSTMQTKATTNNNRAEHIIKIEMDIKTIFSIEHNVHAVIDFSKNRSLCERPFDNPGGKGSTYTLTKDEMDSILKLLKIEDLEKLKSEYTVPKSDQTTSNTTIYTTKRTFIINDYGLKGDYPLQDLYKIIYKY